MYCNSGFAYCGRVEFLFVHSLSCRITQKYMHFVFSGKKMNDEWTNKNSTVDIHGFMFIQCAVVRYSSFPELQQNTDTVDTTTAAIS